MRKKEKDERNPFDRKFEKSKGYPEYQKMLKDFKKSMDETKYLLNQLLLRLKPKFLEEMEKFIRNENGSALDFFIIESCQKCNVIKPTKNYELYRSFWKMFEQYYFNVIKKEMR